jgi:uncharacterized phage-like protein YoqJ
MSNYACLVVVFSESDIDILESELRSIIVFERTNTVFYMTPANRNQMRDITNIVSENATDYLIYYDADNSGSTLFFPTNGAIDQKQNSVIDALNFQAV